MNDFQRDLVDPKIGHYQVLSLLVKVILEVVAIKGYYKPRRYSELEPHQTNQFSVLPRTLFFRVWGLALLQGIK